jgi:transcriptional regulator with XRE-family HTH domain
MRRDEVQVSLQAPFYVSLSLTAWHAPITRRAQNSNRKSTCMIVPEIIQTETFAERLKRLRATAGLTQEQLAERANVSVRTIRNAERPNAHVPRDETIQMLAAALALPPDERAALLAAPHCQRPCQSATPTAQAQKQKRLAVETADHADSRSRKGVWVYIPPPALIIELQGRDADLQKICGIFRALSDTPLSPVVALYGLPGIGKTALAIAVARARQPVFRWIAMGRYRATCSLTRYSHSLGAHAWPLAC